MVNKIKVLIGLAAAVLAVGVVLVLGRGPGSAAEPAGLGAHARAGESSGTTALAGPAGPGRGGPLPTTGAPGGSGPLAFTTAPAADPPGCRDKLAELRTQASEVIPASPALFERARPSPRKQAEIAPIIERVIGRPASKAGYQIECRTSLCRVAVVREPGSAEVQAWFRDLGEDAELGAIRGGRPSAKYSERTKDALTGAPLVKLTFFMGIPQAGDEEHPYEADGGTTCGQRVAALEKALDELREGKRRMQRRGQSGKAPAGRAAGQPGAHPSHGGCLSPDH
jgi:hypothetical protein